MIRRFFVIYLLTFSFFFSFVFALTAGNFKRVDRERLLVGYRFNSTTSTASTNQSTPTTTSKGEGLQHWIPPSKRLKGGSNKNINDKLDTILGGENPYARINPKYNSSIPTNSSANQYIADGIENALGPGQDPSPISRIESDGKRHYYFPTIDFGKGVYMQTSTDLNTVLSEPSNEYSIFNFTENIGTEAPALFEWSENNYLLYISSIGEAGKGYVYVLYNDGQDLLSGWQELGTVKDSNGNSIINYDAFPFNHPNGNKYLLFSALHSIQISELIGFTQLGLKPPTVIVPFSGIENPPVIEAPGAFIQGSTLNVYYSENQYFLPNYNTLNIAISTDLDPLDEQNWNSFGIQSTILQSNNQTGVYGTGSGGSFIGPNGQPWFAYTCFYNPNGFDQTNSNPRRVQVQPLSFNENNELIEIIPDQPIRFIN